MTLLTIDPSSTCGVIEFSAPILVRAKQGDRSRIAKSKDGKLYVFHYPNRKVLGSGRELAVFAKRHAPAQPLDGPIRLDLTFVAPWRASESKQIRSLGERAKDTKPDLDNLAKQVCDILESLGFYKNDAQISDLHLSKRWGPEPRLDVRVERLAHSR